MEPLDLVVYGDFNCPFSALASARAARLERAGIARVTFCAVEHDPDIPAEGIPVEGQVRAHLDEELEQIRGLMTERDADVVLRRPPVRANTRRAVEVYASTPVPERAACRAELFRRYWAERAELLGDGAPSPTESGRATAAEWHQEWLASGSQIVPIMRLPDGYVSRGLGALRRLAELESAAP